MKQPHKYTGSVYIGIVGPDGEYGPCRDSIERLARRGYDSPLQYIRATKGYEARQWHINKFIESHYDFIFLMDVDMIFPQNALERLRSHEMPYLSGFYMRRNLDAMGPVWYRPFTGKFPLEPWVGEIEEGQLHRIGASGWGCILAHRSVILGVRELLKGEWEVLEDDMDVWAYDLERIMGGVNGLQRLIDDNNDNKIARQAFLNEIKEEFRPLRCDREQIGSDIRFPFYALQAGFQLYGDPGVLCGHMTNMELGLAHYNAIPKERVAQVKKEQRREVNRQRKLLTEQKESVLNA